MYKGNAHSIGRTIAALLIGRGVNRKAVLTEINVSRGNHQTETGLSFTGDVTFNIPDVEITGTIGIAINQTSGTVNATFDLGDPQPYTLDLAPGPFIRLTVVRLAHLPV